MSENYYTYINILTIVCDSSKVRAKAQAFSAKSLQRRDMIMRDSLRARTLLRVAPRQSSVEQNPLARTLEISQLICVTIFRHNGVNTVSILAKNTKYYRLT